MEVQGMSFTRNKLSAAVQAGVALGAFAAPGILIAQDEAQTLDRIEVTGSRIRQVEVETAQPVLSITREDIETQGFRSVADILQNVTAVGAPAISRTAPLSSGENVGGYYIDLRNLGASRTLILINGKRMGITTAGLQDLASVPSSIIERIDVLKDGASSIYGSDAIAGVVNIITRSGYEGAEANAYFGEYTQGDGTKQTYDFVMGFTGDRGSLTTSVEYTKEDPVMASDRWFSRTDVPRFPHLGWTTISQWGAIIGGPEGGGVDGSYWSPGTGPTTDFSTWHPTDPTGITGDTSNPNEQMWLLNATERRSFFMDGRYDITDSVAFRTDVLYSDRAYTNQIAGYPCVAGNCANTAMSIDSWYNPLGNWHGYEEPQAIAWARRGWEVPRQVFHDLTTYRFTGGFEGAFEIGERYWNWDVGYMYNKNDASQTGTGNYNLVNLALAVGPSFMNDQGIVQCGTPDNPLPLGYGPGQCTPFNPFASSRNPGPNGNDDENVQRFLYPRGQALSETETVNYFANITGTLFELPAGELAMAAGYEYRRESGFFSPDAFAQTGLSTDLASGPTEGGYSLDEFYAELDIPILADIPFARELSFNVASRYSDYTTFGDTLNSKAGLRWRPIDDLLVRTTWAEGFRAPTVSDLYGGTSDSFESYTDPCDTVFGNAAFNAETMARCLQDVPEAFRQLQQGGIPAEGPNAQSPVPFTSGSNPFLTPETSTSKTLGFVYSPGFVEGLNVSVDWWHIRIENTIVGDTPNAILEDCYVSGIQSRCQLFTRDPATGQVATLAYGGANAGYVETEGFDVDLNYAFDTDIGRFGVAWLNTYTSKNNTKIDDEPDTPESPAVSFPGNFRLRSNLSLTWDLGDFGVTYGARYFSAQKEACSFEDECTHPDYEAPDTGPYPINRTGSNTFHDLQVRWNAPWNATVAVGANNITNHFGPPMYNLPTSLSSFSYYGGFDIGRFWYASYKQRF
jgi:iron complex outermembrane receptor protein